MRITLSIESPLRYFDEAPLVRATAGEPGIGGHHHLGTSRDWTFDVPADALAASGGTVTIETNQHVCARRNAAGRPTSGVWACACFQSECLIR